MRERICQLGREGKTVIVDSRDRIGLYDHVIVKPNEVEAVHAFGDAGKEDLESLSVLASKISVQNECPTLMTLGEKGCFVDFKLRPGYNQRRI